MTTWKVGDGWITFGASRKVGISGGKMASKQDCFGVTTVKPKKVKRTK